MGSERQGQPFAEASEEGALSMQGEKRFEPKLYYDVNLVDFVGRDHFLVRLDRAVSLEWVRERTKSYYSYTGKPSVDPVVLVKMLLVGYLYDVRSERRLVEEIRLNLAYRWYVGYDLDEEVPDHSIFTKARARFGRKLFLELFEEILAQCAKAGLVKGDGVLIDSTLVKADASMNSIVEVSLAPEIYWRELDKEEERSDSPRGRKPKDGLSSQVGSHFNQSVDPKKLGKRRRDRNAAYLRKRSTTDPEATVHHRPGIGGALSYKVHAAVDTSGVITAVTASPSAEHDTSQLPALVSVYSKNLGELPTMVAADSTYGSSEALSFLQQQGIKTAIPPMPARGHPGCFPKSAFKRDKENDSYLCPEGKVLRRRAKNQKTGQIHYKAREEDCSSCPSRRRCISGKGARVRTITRTDGDHFDQAREFLDSPAGKSLFNLRKTVVEGIFGQSKAFHGLSRAKMRGLEKMEIQALLTATAINLKKLVNSRISGLPCAFLSHLQLRRLKGWVLIEASAWNLSAT